MLWRRRRRKLYKFYARQERAVGAVQGKEFVSHTTNADDEGAAANAKGKEFVGQAKYGNTRIANQGTVIIF